MKKKLLILLTLILTLGCSISKSFTTNGYDEVSSKVNIYFDNTSSQDVKATVLLDHVTSFGGITLEKNTTGSVIQVNFENVDEGEGNLGIEITTSDSAIQYVHLTAFEIIKLEGERRYSMNYPKNKVKVKDLESTGIAIEIERSF